MVSMISYIIDRTLRSFRRVVRQPKEPLGNKSLITTLGTEKLIKYVSNDVRSRLVAMRSRLYTSNASFMFPWPNGLFERRPENLMSVANRTDDPSNLWVLKISFLKVIWLPWWTADKARRLDGRNSDEKTAYIVCYFEWALRDWKYISYQL